MELTASKKNRWIDIAPFNQRNRANRKGLYTDAAYMFQDCFDAIVVMSVYNMLAF